MTIKTGARRLGGLVLLTAAPAMAQTEPQTESAAVQDATPVTREMVRLRGELDQLREEVERAHQAEPAVEDGIKLGGAVRFNYGYRDWNQSDKDKLGTAAFDTFRINADGSFNDVLLSAEFRWYRYQSVLHHAWAGYNFTDNLQAQLGVSQVPFGLLPYASHSFWFGLPYYVGLEDDYDSGFKLLYNQGNFSLDAAFYKGEEWGTSTTNQRYSYDVYNDGPHSTPTRRATSSTSRPVTSWIIPAAAPSSASPASTANCTTPKPRTPATIGRRPPTPTSSWAGGTSCSRPGTTPTTPRTRPMPMTT